MLKERQPRKLIYLSSQSNLFHQIRNRNRKMYPSPEFSVFGKIMTTKSVPERNRDLDVVNLL